MIKIRRRLTKVTIVICAFLEIILYNNCTGFSPSGSGTITNASMGTQTPTTTVPVPPTNNPPPVGATPFPVVGDFKSIPSNFDVNQYLTGTVGVNVPPDNGSDPVGAFRFLCAPSHLLYDDPIVYPGRANTSHLHQFYGNDKADANSTYQSLRTTGTSTCGGGPLSRSAYWMPAMMNGKGKVVQPDYIAVYYKRLPETDPTCQQMGQACVPMPIGLRMIAGYSMATGTANGKMNFQCNQQHWPTMIEAAKNCPNIQNNTPQGVGLISAVDFPFCWDGVHLDSADHRSHMAYASYGSWGYAKCPATHPFVIPVYTIKAVYPVDSDFYANLDANGNWNQKLNGWHLSSDEMNNSQPGSTNHADWFGAWDDDIMATWTKFCINGHLNCSAGQLGDGRGMVYPKTTSNTSPVIVDPPPGGMPGMPGMSQ